MAFYSVSRECGLRMSGLNLGGFLFGNIDESGALEDEFLDDVSTNKLI